MTIVLKIISTVPRLYKPRGTLPPVGVLPHLFRRYYSGAESKTTTQESLKELDKTLGETAADWERSKSEAKAMLETTQKDFDELKKSLKDANENMEGLSQEIRRATIRNIVTKAILGFFGGLALTTIISIFLKLKNEADLRDAEELLLTELNPATLKDELAALGYIPGFKRGYFFGKEEFFLDVLNNVFRKLPLTLERGFSLSFLLKSAVAEIIRFDYESANSLLKKARQSFFYSHLQSSISGDLLTCQCLMAYLQENHTLSLELIARAKNEYILLQQKEGHDLSGHYSKQLHILSLLELKIALRSKPVDEEKLYKLEEKFAHLLRHKNHKFFVHSFLDFNDMLFSVTEPQEDFISKMAKIELAFAWLKLAARQTEQFKKEKAITKAKELLPAQENTNETNATRLLERQRQIILAQQPDEDLQLRTLELVRYNGNTAIAQHDPSTLSNMSGTKDYLLANHPSFFDNIGGDLNQWEKVGTQWDGSGKLVFRALYNKATSELMLVFRGKEPGIELFTELTMYKSDGLPPQLINAENFLKHALRSVKIKYADNAHIRVVLTGYSDGAILAECLLAKLTADEKLQSDLQNKLVYPIVESKEAVTFNSPGSQQIISRAFPTLVAHPSQLNITTILTPPSLITIWGGHLGKVIQVNIHRDVHDAGNGSTNNLLYALDPGSFLYSQGLLSLAMKNSSNLLYSVLNDSTGRLLSAFGLWAMWVWLPRAALPVRVNELPAEQYSTLLSSSMKGLMCATPVLWLAHLIYYSYTRTYTLHSFNLLFQQFMLDNMLHTSSYSYYGVTKVLSWPTTYDGLRAYDYGRKWLHHTQQNNEKGYYQHLVSTYAGYEVGETDSVLHEIERHELPPALWDLLIKKYFKGKDALSLDPHIIQIKILNDKIYILNDYPADYIKSYLITTHLNILNKPPTAAPTNTLVRPVLFSSIFTRIKPFFNLGTKLPDHEKENLGLSANPVGTWKRKEA